MLCHLSALAGFIGVPLGNIIGPLIIWLVKKDEIPFVDLQGRESLNFQISMTIYGTVAGFLVWIFVGWILLAVLAVVNIVLVIIASVRAAGARDSAILSPSGSFSDVRLLDRLPSTGNHRRWRP
jgi:uncharacterized Tic20 family protein